MLELVKRNIHMNRWKNQVGTQVTLEDDFIVPDTMGDIAQVILDTGEIQMDPVKNPDERVQVRGRLDFHVLYRREEGGLQTLGGLVPFEETVNVPGLTEQDYVSVSWQLEDLQIDILNSRKLPIRAVVTLEVKVEALFDTEAAVELKNGSGDDDAESGGMISGVMERGMTGRSVMERGDEPQIEVRRKNLEVAAIALRRRDTYRVRDEITLSGTKPAIERILWSEMRLAGTSTRPLDGKIHLEGSLLIFVLYEGEGEQPVIQWVEESIPFSGEVELLGCVQELIPVISLSLVHRGLEEKPDYDGEMRELDVDAVIELDIRLYEEKELALLDDLYATNRELIMETGEAVFDRILTHNTGKCKLAEKLPVDAGPQFLQVCHSSGAVKVDEVEVKENALLMNGVLEVRLLYLTDDDKQPIQSRTEMLPFSYEAEAPGVTEESVRYLETGLEQLTAVLAGGGNVEIRAVITLDLLVLHPVNERVILQAQLEPLDTKRLQEMPGIVGYLAQEGDTLWSIAKRFHTTVDAILSANGLSSETIVPGDVLILVKEIVRG
ncbi:MAG: DUF3794 domain-containing protein [Clostridiales bacterium]|nr:DUF3794 domain-containing protein [Clostridiales bacterium]